MSQNLTSLSMLRNAVLFADKAAAITGIQNATTNDGVIKLGRYINGTGVKTIFGIYNEANDGKSAGYTIYDFDADAEAALQAIINRIDGDTGTTGSFRKAIKDAVEALDYTGDTGVTGQYVKTITEQDGIISVTFGQVAASEVSNSSEKAAISATTTVQAALDALADKAAAITIANADGSINVTTAATGTDINVNIKSGEKVLAKDGDAGLYTDIKLSSVTVSDTNVKEQFALIGTDGSKLGADIKIYKDSAYKEIYLGTSGDTINTSTGEITKLEGDKQSLNYAYMKADGTYDLVKVDVSKFLVESEFASGVTSTSGIVHGVVDGTSESFLTVGADGFKLSGVQNAITNAINALDVTGDTAVAGQYIATVNEENGLISLTRANVSDAVLTGYAKGEKPASTAVAATDDVKGAIAKLEHQVDDAKAAATTEVVEGTDSGNNLTIVSATSQTDGHVTYTVNLTDVASASGLDAEIAARKAVDGQTGQTYAANTSANYISAATSLNDADVKLDTQVKANADAIAQEVLDRDAAISAAVNTLDVEAITAGEGEFIKSVSEADGKISATTAEMPTVAAISGTGQAITAVSQDKGTISAVAGDIAAEHVTVADTAEKFTGSTVEAVLAEIDTAYKAADTGIIGQASDSANTLGKLEGIINGIVADAKTYTISAITTGQAATTQAAYGLFDEDGVQSGATIIIPKDNSFVSGWIGHIDDTIDQTSGVVTPGSGSDSIDLKYINNEGKYVLVTIDIESYLKEAEAGSGINISNHTINVKFSTDAETQKYLSFEEVQGSTAAIKLSGIDDAIAAAQSAATTELSAGTGVGANEHINITETAAADGHKIYTLSASDIASASALTAETAARKAVTGIDGDAYSANTADTYISGATSLKDADDKLDAAIKGIADDFVSAATVNGSAVTISDNTIALTVAGKTSNATSTGNEAIVVETAEGGGVTLGLGTLDCGTY